MLGCILVELSQSWRNLGLDSFCLGTPKRLESIFGGAVVALGAALDEAGPGSSGTCQHAPSLVGMPRLSLQQFAFLLCFSLFLIILIQLSFYSINQ